MKDYGQTGVYVGATSPIGLPTPKRRKHRASKSRHVCGECALPLVRPGAFHICLDLTQPEPVKVKAVKAPKVKKETAPRSKATARPRKPKSSKTCIDCGVSGLYATSLRCKPCDQLSRRNLTPEQDKEVAAMYAEIRSAKKVAAHFGVSEFAITASLDRMGVPRPGKGAGGGGAWRALDENTVDQIVAAYTSGVAVSDICKQQGLAERTIYKAIRKRGAIKPKKGRVSVGTRAFTPEQDAQLAAAYRSGGTIAGLANQHGVSQPAVRAALIREGVEIRGRGVRAA